MTTASRTGRTVVFVEGGVVDDKGKGTTDLPLRDDKKGIDYLAPADGIGLDHVMASAAMPILFPSVRIGLNDGTSDWFFDGGLRLNAPIKPAIKLGADRIAIVAADPAWRPAQDSQVCGALPDIDDFALHFLQAGLADPLIEDMWTLAGINTLLDQGAATPDRKRIEYLFVGPRRRGELGCVAGEVVREMPWGLFKTLGWALGRQGSQHHELLSYLLFDPAFFTEAIRQGQRDAQREIERMEGENLTWRVDAPPQT